MTAVDSALYGVGAREGRIFPLDANGVPAATSTAVYEGLQIVGIKGLDYSIPDIRRISHVGDDRVLAQDWLPRQEVSSGSIRFNRSDFDLFAALSGTKVDTVGEAKFVGFGTDQQGSEADVCLMVVQQAKAASSKTRVWSVRILPSCQMIVNPIGAGENANEYTAQVVPDVATAYPWGIAFTVADNGFTEAEMLEGATVGYPTLVAWKGDGTEDEFLFPTAKQATATAKIHAVSTIATDGTVTDVTSTATLATSKVTITPAPGDGVMIVAFYETAA